MSDEKTPDDYEVGYRKPPKNTRFQKGMSGNPRGRPKKALDLDAELLRQAKSLVTISENGRKIRVSKHDVVMRQLLLKAMTGDIPALKTYLGYYQQTVERAALAAQPQCNESKKYDDVRTLTDEELMRLAAGALEKMDQEI